jgi:hypothetical protein
VWKKKNAQAVVKITYCLIDAWSSRQMEEQNLESLVKSGLIVCKKKNKAIPVMAVEAYSVVRC